MRTIHLFPGQGFQQVGMMVNYLKNPVCFNVYNRLVKLVPKLQEVMETGPQERLNSTEMTQPAIFLHSYLAFLNGSQTTPSSDFFIGHSLGEITALTAAGVLSPEDGLKIAAKRGEIMQRESQPFKSGMLVIKSGDYGLIENKLNELRTKVEFSSERIALYNSLSQTVVSGLTDNLKVFQKLLKEEKVNSVFLPVSSAFHNPLLEKASQQFRDYLLNNTELKFKDVSNVISMQTSQPHGKNCIDNLCKQLTEPVRFCQTIEAIHKQYPQGLKYNFYGSGVLQPFVNEICGDVQYSIY